VTIADELDDLVEKAKLVEQRLRRSEHGGAHLDLLEALVLLVRARSRLDEAEARDHPMPAEAHP
jgi:hypothetical protein